METKQAQRIQTSLLSAPEKRVLVYLAERQPRWMTSDGLTFIGSFGAFLFALGFILSTRDVHWLWLSSFGMIVNWYGDSLDGTLARVRNRQRPRYGYYLDHTVDCINEGMMLVGVGLSGWMHLELALLALILYLFMTINVSINAHLKSEFKISYGKLGPTEFRILVITADTLLIMMPGIQHLSWTSQIFGRDFSATAFDMFAGVVIVVLGIIFIATVIFDAKYYASLEPLKDKEE